MGFLLFTRRKTYTTLARLLQKTTGRSENSVATRMMAMTHERYLLYGVILVAAGICLFLFLLVRTLRAALDRADQKIYGFYSDPEKMNHLREYWTRIEGE
ncbi:hypothetical protein WDV93_25010 [Pantoea ananatis]